MSQQQNSNHKECLMFIDGSNLWIEGQALHASKLKLTDVKKDPRFRIDYGKLVELLIEDRYMSKCFIYGSNPCLIDTIWKIKEKYNFIVKIFERSCIGKEKEVDVAMVCDMLQSLYESPDIDNVTFIVVTGDRDFKRPVEIILEKRVHVELWSWEHSLAKEFKQISHVYFSLQKLDATKEAFSFTAFESTRKNINPDCAIVFKNVPADKSFLDNFLNNMNSIQKLFFVTKLLESGHEQDLVLEFPKTPIDEILETLAGSRHLEYKPIRYTEYIDQEATENIDVPETSEDESEHTPLYDPPSQQEEPNARRCAFGDHCARGLDCSYQHTEEERELFSRNILNHQFRKTRRCKNNHPTIEEREKCNFAHNTEEVWCLKCKKYGHFTH